MSGLMKFWRSGIVAKGVIILVGFVVLCCAPLTIIGLVAPKPAVQPTQAAAIVAAAPKATAPQSTTVVDTSVPTIESTATIVSTETSVPTNTPAPPTETPMPPTETAVPPTPTSPPQPVVLKGRGQTVTDPFVPPSALSRVTFTHSGKSNFIVKVYDDQGSEDYMVNAIGKYQGIRPLLAKGKVYFEVNADGPWSINVEAITADNSFAAGMEGHGDFVSNLFDPTAKGPVPYAFMHNGDANFIVQLACAGGQDFVQNKIGPVDGSAVVNFAQGPCFWDVKANGDWSIKPK